MKQQSVEYLFNIQKKDKIIRKSAKMMVTAESPNEAQDRIVKTVKMFLEQAVINSGQVPNYNGIFAVIRHADNQLWMLIEYRPCFRYDIHKGSKDIFTFTSRLGVKLV